MMPDSSADSETTVQSSKCCPELDVSEETSCLLPFLSNFIRTIFMLIKLIATQNNPNKARGKNLVSPGCPPFIKKEYANSEKKKKDGIKLDNKQNKRRKSR